MSTQAWPWWIKLLHALNAGAFFALAVMTYAYAETGWWHRTLGYMMLSAVILRLLLTFLPIFTDAHQQKVSKLYLPNFKHMRAHVMELYSAIQSRQPMLNTSSGHNPIGLCAVYAMWLLVGLLALTGWLSRTDAYWGEDGPVELHAILATLLIGLVSLHLCAVVLMSYLHRQNLVYKMWRLDLKNRQLNHKP